MLFQDKVLTCRDCSQQFTWTAGEQEFYQQKGLLHAPQRCAEHRARARQERAARREMHEITCGNCGRQAQVPFAPRLDRPVFCSDCFEKIKARN